MFQFNDEIYDYLLHPYNSTRLNERTIEVPIAQRFIESIDSDNVLEIGCVLPHYLDEYSHVVIDKHETFPGVINEDIRTWESDNLFDGAISISTFEHVASDWHEIVKAIDSVMSKISEGSRFLLTMPYGFNRHVDLHVHSLETSHNANVWRMDKVDFQRHLWKQIYSQKIPLAYNQKSRWANTIYIVSIEK